MENWAAKVDRESDEQNARRLRTEIDKLKEQYANISNEDLEEKTELLETIRKKYEELRSCLYDDDEVEIVEREMASAEALINKFEKIIENNRIAKVNEDSFVDGDTPEPIKDADGNVIGFRQDGDRDF